MTRHFAGRICEGTCSGRLRKERRGWSTTNHKYEITGITHEKYPFLHRIRALRDVGGEVKSGDLGGFVESESNLSYEPGDDAWIFDDAIVCNNAYVDRGSCLRGSSVACDNAYVSRGAALTGQARAEDDAYVRGAVLTGHARASGFAVIVNDQDTGSAPTLSGHCAAYGRVSGDVRLTGSALVISGEEIQNDTLDTIVMDGQARAVIRDASRDELAPREQRRLPTKKKQPERSQNR